MTEMRTERATTWPPDGVLAKDGMLIHVLRRLGQMLLQDVVHEVGRAPHLHLREDPRPVRAYGLDAPGQIIGDPTDACAAAEETQDLVLPVGKACVQRLVRPVAVAERCDQLLGSGRTHVPSSLGQQLDGPDQLLGRRRLVDASGRSGAKRAHRELFIGLDAEDEMGSFGRSRLISLATSRPLQSGRLRSRTTTSQGFWATSRRTSAPVSASPS